jgi:hypothetical protein
MSSSNQEEEEDAKKPSGKELRQSSSSKPQSEEPQREVITNTNVDIHASTPTNTGEDPTLVKANPADNFKKGQVLVNSDGEEI